MNQSLPADAPSFSPPRWVSWLIALVPVFPPLYLAAFGALKLLRTLPLPARYTLCFFASTQLVAALFTPRPLLSLGLAAARTLFILAMISAGVYLRDTRNLRPLLWGQLVIFATAWGYTLYTQGFAGIQARLGHPYYYIVSLGLVAVVALWLIVFWRGGNLWWRVPAGMLTIATFLAAGSRGPLLALVSGSIAAAFLSIRQYNRRTTTFIIATMVIFLVFFLNFLIKIPIQPIQRLINDQTSGREFIWKNAIQGWKSSPIGGVGAYQGGLYLTYLYKDGCQLTPTLQRNSLSCPPQILKLNSVWLIAHNAVLHWLLESGLLGTLGLSVYVIYIFILILKIKNHLLLAIFIGFTFMNNVDVVIAIPSQHFSELWWSVTGLVLINSPQTSGISNE